MFDPTPPRQRMQATKFVSLTLGVSLLAAVPTKARADVVLIDFFGMSAQTSLTGLTFVRPGGLVVDLTRPGSTFALTNLNGTLGSSFFNPSLDPFADTGNSPFILNFN